MHSIGNKNLNLLIIMKDKSVYSCNVAEVKTKKWDVSLKKWRKSLDSNE